MSRTHPEDDRVDQNEPQDGVEPQADAPDGDAPQEDVRKLQEERDNLQERLLRTAADFKNTQRRLEQDKEQAIQFANTTLLKALLPVIDNFERAMSVDATKTDAAAILKGLQIVHDQLVAVLKGQRVEVIAPEPGTPFDPSRHEALMQQPSDQYDEPTVTQLLQKGYALHGRTLRPAGVAVSISQ